MEIPLKALATLRKIAGKDNVRTDTVSLLLNAYDCSRSRMRPDVIVHITKTAQIAQVVRVLHAYSIPFVVRAAATNHAGSCSTPNGGAVLEVAALNRMLEINTKERYARVEPGVITGQLDEKLRPLGYFYAPDPASKSFCTIGGNAAQNASGARCLKYGGTLDHVLALKVVLSDGTELTLDRRESGPDLVGLFIGSEGTFGVITELTVKILPLPAHLKTFLVTFNSLDDCINTVTGLIAQGIIPRCVEAMDKRTLNAVEDFAHAGYPKEAEALLLIELDGPSGQIEKEQAVLETVCRQHNAQTLRTAHSEEERAQLWKGRQAAYAAMARLAPTVLVCDGTVPRNELPRTLRRVQEILDGHDITACLLFHAGDGNFHPQLIFDGRKKIDSRALGQAVKQILQACVDAGGTLSGEHGIGIEKRGLMAYQYDRDTLEVFSRVKRALDPQHLANPSKIIPVDFEEKAAPAKPLADSAQSVFEAFHQARNTHRPFFITGQNSVLHTTAPHHNAPLLNQMVEIDLTNYMATVQTGVTLSQLAAALREKNVYSTLPDNTKGTLGGAFSSGQFPGFYADVTGLQAVLPDGKIIRYGGKLTKNAAGYNLIRLFAGTQGALGWVTQLTFKIYAAPKPPLTPRTFAPLAPNELFNRLKRALDPQNLLRVPESKK